MKVVFDSFDSFQLAEFDFFLRLTRPTLESRHAHVTGTDGSTVSSAIELIVRRL